MSRTSKTTVLLAVFFAAGSSATRTGGEALSYLYSDTEVMCINRLARIPATSNYNKADDVLVWHGGIAFVALAPRMVPKANVMELRSPVNRRRVFQFFCMRAWLCSPST